MNGFLLGLLKGEKWWIRWIVGLVVLVFFAGMYWSNFKNKLEAYDKQLENHEKRIEKIENIIMPSLQRIEEAVGAKNAEMLPLRRKHK